MMETEVEKQAQESSFWDFKGDEEFIDNYFLMRCPFPMLLILGAYLLFVLKLGPQLMKNRPAYKLRKILLVYNAFQVVYSTYIACLGAQAVLELGLLETKCVMHDKKLKLRLAGGHYLYFIAKLTELLDTVFFVLRKKWNQITFLHVYHHGIMFLSTWITLKYEPTYSLVFLGSVNSFVHVIMYTYYGLSAFPKLQKYLWWKIYITKMQLTQFLIVLVQIIWSSRTAECPISYILNSICIFHGFLFIYLFSDFYFKSYNKKRDGDSKTSGQSSQLEKDAYNASVSDSKKQSLNKKNR